MVGPDQPGTTERLSYKITYSIASYGLTVLYIYIYIYIYRESILCSWLQNTLFCSQAIPPVEREPFTTPTASRLVNAGLAATVSVSYSVDGK
jgi:hypothetical protein